MFLLFCFFFIECKVNTSIESTQFTSHEDFSSENCIPESVRYALENAGINIDQIVKMTNQLEISLKELDLFDLNSNRKVRIDSSPVQPSSSLLQKQSNFDYEFPITESLISNGSTTQVASLSKSNENCSSKSLLKNQPSYLSVNSLENNHIQNSNHSMENILNKCESSNLVSSVSNMRAVNIQQNVNTRISHEVYVSSSDNLYQNKNDIPFTSKFNNETKNGRKKTMSSTRYATVSNFTIPLERHFSNDKNANKLLSNSVVLVNILIS